MGGRDGGMGDVEPAGLVRRLAGLIPRASTTPRQAGRRPASDWLIGQMRKKLARIAADSPRRADLLSEIGVALAERFQETGHLGYLDEAIEAARASVSAAGRSAAALRGKCLNNLGLHLLTRYRRTGSVPDLDEALSASRAAVDAVPPDSGVRGLYLGSLSVAVRAQAELTGSRDDLDEAIDLATAALSAAPRGDPRRAAFLAAVGNAYLARFQAAGDPGDAAAAVRHLREGVAEFPPGHPGHSLAAGGLVAALTAQFGESGDVAGAAEAISTARAAVDASRGSARALCLSSLGGALRARYERAGEIADLDEAIAAVRAAADSDATPAELVMYASNLGALLTDRFERTRDPAVLDEVIGAARHAVELAVAMGLSGQPYLPGCQTILGTACWRRFQRTQDPADLEKSIEFCRAAVRGASPGHPSRPMFLHNLANTLLSDLFRRREQSWTADEIAEIIDMARAAAEAVPDGHPNRVGYLLNLGTALEARFRLTGNERDMADAFACWRTAAGTRAGPASKRLTVASRWGRAAASYGMSGEAEAGFAEAVDLLPLQAWRGLRRRTREEVLSGRTGLASDAAAWAISNRHLERAVELLELGRNVLWSQSLQLRGDLDDLYRDYPGIARGLDALREILDQAEDPSTYWAPAATQQAGFPRPRPPAETRRRDEARIAAARDWDRLMDEVRALPGYESFLRAPAYAELTSGIGDRTVVIINVSRYRCDALAVSPSGVRLIPLPELTHDAATRQAARFREALGEFGRSAAAEAHDGRAETGPGAAEPGPGDRVTEVLAWLGATVAFPVLDALGHVATATADPRQLPRVWWCPTGPLAALPLHAAGAHGSGQRASAVHDRTVSSYLPSLRALHRAGERGRRAAARAAARRHRPNVLLVTMPTTPGLPDGAPLMYAGKEASVVAGHFPLTVTHYDGRAATRQAVLRALPAHDYAHFACHGFIDPAEPAASGLCVADGRLTIAALSERDLPADAARFAFLSACHSSAASPDLPDETITMAAALQLTGFRHVIATMWAISDRSAPVVADEVYTALAADQETVIGEDLPAAYALHAAITKLRAMNSPLVNWTAYIHTGP